MSYHVQHQRGLLSPRDTWGQDSGYLGVISFRMPNMTPPRINAYLLDHEAPSFVFSHIRISRDGFFVFRFSEAADDYNGPTLSYMDALSKSEAIMPPNLFEEDLQPFAAQFRVSYSELVLGYDDYESIPSQDDYAIDFYCEFGNAYFAQWHDTLYTNVRAIDAIYEGDLDIIGWNHDSLPVPFHFHVLAEEDFNIPYHLPGHRLTFLFYLLCSRQMIFDNQGYVARWGTAQNATDVEDMLRRIHELADFYPTVVNSELRPNGLGVTITLSGYRLGLRECNYSVRTMQHLVDLHHPNFDLLPSTLMNYVFFLHSPQIDYMWMSDSHIFSEGVSNESFDRLLVFGSMRGPMNEEMNIPPSLMQALSHLERDNLRLSPLSVNTDSMMDEFEIEFNVVHYDGEQNRSDGVSVYERYRLDLLMVVEDRLRENAQRQQDSPRQGEEEGSERETINIILVKDGQIKTVIDNIDDTRSKSLF